MREDLGAARYVAAASDFQTAEAVDEREGTDPRPWTDFGLSRDPAVGVIGIGRNPMRKRTFFNAISVCGIAHDFYSSMPRRATQRMNHPGIGSARRRGSRGCVCRSKQRRYH